MNIQFMTAEANGIATREKRWNGEPVYKYIPNYSKMIENASCEAEAEAIRECRELFEKLHEGFAFQIVYTIFTKRLNPYTLETEQGWTIYQHPWYADENGQLLSKEEMLKTIEAELQ